MTSENPTGRTRVQRIEDLAYGIRVNEREKEDLLLLLSAYRYAKSHVELNPQLPDSLPLIAIKRLIKEIES